jgi:manganese/zinc/iron transport system permease protein
VESLLTRLPLPVQVGLGVSCLAALGGVYGTLTLARKQIFVGDLLGHAMLPGLVVGLLAAGHLNTWWLSLCGFSAGLTALGLVQWVVQHTRLPRNQVQVGVTGLFLGLGYALLSVMQQSPQWQTAGLEGFLIGKIANLTAALLEPLLTVALMLALGLILVWRGLVFSSFDAVAAHLAGLHRAGLEAVFAGLLAALVVVLVQAVGALLAVTLLIGPAIAGARLTDNLRHQVFFSVCAGIASGVTGVGLSLAFPHTPAGPWIALVSCLIPALFGLFSSPKHS